MPYEEKHLIFGKMRVVAIETKFKVTVPETGEEKNVFIMDLHPFICGSGPMSHDETEETTEQEHFAIPTAHGQEQGYPSTPLTPSSACSDRSRTCLESGERHPAGAASSSSWEVL